MWNVRVRRALARSAAHPRRGPERFLVPIIWSGTPRGHNAVDDGARARWENVPCLLHRNDDGCEVSRREFTLQSIFLPRLRRPEGDDVGSLSANRVEDLPVAPEESAVNDLDRAHHFEPRVLRDDGLALLDLEEVAVRGHADHELMSERFRLRQVVDVTRVQELESARGEDARCHQAGQRFSGRERSAEPVRR